MAITYPLDLLSGFPGTSTRFELELNQEIDPLRSGDQVAKDLGPAVWVANYQSRVLKPTELRRWKARISSLVGAMHTFKGYDLTACYPMAYPNGSWPTGLAFDGMATIADAEPTALALGGLPAGYVVSEGDYIAFEYGPNDARALHQALESVQANETGVTSLFRVEPELRPGFPDGGGSPATVAQLVQPYALMVVLPGSLSATSDLSGRGTISFSARQTP